MANAVVSAGANAPPLEVIVEFLDALMKTVHSHDGIVPVLRGSTLMRHWFAGAARPARDIDLEWVQTDEDVSVVSQARRVAMFAVMDHVGKPIQFCEASGPAEGTSLWEYATAGVRCHTGWTWKDRGLKGLLQIDIAESAGDDVSRSAFETVELPRASGELVRMLGYSPEMLLAAKLSWIVRHLLGKDGGQLGVTDENGRKTVWFHGEPKDVFDAHLLATQGRLRPEILQDALLIVAQEDKLEWECIDLLLEGARNFEVIWNNKWADLIDAQGGLADKPSPMLQTVVMTVSALAGELRPHRPFLAAIQSEPADEANLLIYADWLEDRGDARGEFVRRFCEFLFHDSKAARAALASSLPQQPRGWLSHVFGGTERSRNLRKRIGAAG